MKKHLIFNGTEAEHFVFWPEKDGLNAGEPLGPTEFCTSAHCTYCAALFSKRISRHIKMR